MRVIFSPARDRRAMNMQEEGLLYILTRLSARKGGRSAYFLYLTTFPQTTWPQTQFKSCRFL